MVQIIYALAALMTAILLSLRLFTGTLNAEQRVYFNELATQMLGVGSRILGDLGSIGIAFDAETNDFILRQTTPNLEYPLVRNPSDLTGVAEFGACTDYDVCLQNPLGDADLDDFDGLQFTVVAGDLSFDVAIAVYYVDHNNPGEPQQTPSWAKEVEVTVQHPAVVMGGQPLTIRTSRIYVYDRIIS